jgi:hypothetical protein
MIDEVQGKVVSKTNIGAAGKSFSVVAAEVKNDH